MSLKGISQASPVLDRAIEAALGLVYPSECPSCKKPSDSFRTSPICSSCFSGLSRYEGPRCIVCGKPFRAGIDTACGECLGDPPKFSRTVFYGVFEGTLRDMILELKVAGRRRLARRLAEMLSSLDIPKADCIVPVPMDIKGIKERGFNQTALVARWLSKSTGIPVLSGFLLKTRETAPQTGLSAKERFLNMKGAFSAEGKLNGEHVIILDDVVTTGATVRECAKALRKAGAGEIAIAAPARTALR